MSSWTTLSCKNNKSPSNLKELKSFLGLVGYYRRFIENFSQIATPLNFLTKKDTKFQWITECELAFRRFKEILVAPPLLQFPNFDKPFFLTTDASGKAIGAVLSQGVIGTDLPISFASRTLNTAEQNYDASERELLAAVWGMKHFRPYLYGRYFTIVTDHRPFLWIFNVRDLTSRLLKWAIKLEEYDYKIVYKPGKLNTNADGLSRIYSVSGRSLEYSDYLDYMNSHIIFNKNVKETKDIIIGDIDNIVLFIPQNLEMSSPELKTLDEQFKIIDKLKRGSITPARNIIIETKNKSFL